MIPHLPLYNTSKEAYTCFLFCCGVWWYGTSWFYPFLSGIVHWRWGHHQCWKFPQVCQSEADNFRERLGTFFWFFINFMFMIWESRHKDLQLFWQSFKYWSSYDWPTVSEITQAWINNCIPQYSVGCNYLSLPVIPASSTKMLIQPKQHKNAYFIGCTAYA